MVKILGFITFPGFAPFEGEVNKDLFDPTHKLPLNYFNAGKGDRATTPRLAAYVISAAIAGFCAQGFVLSAPMLLMRSWFGVDLPGVDLALAGDWRTIFVFLVFSFLMGAYGYYTHCSKIEAWTQLKQNEHTQESWKCQPNKWPDHETHQLSVKLGTLNAGCAAVYGTATTILHLKGGYTALYFDVAEYGLVWYLLSWAVFLTWIEFFAYWFHRFFHLKFIYKHFHKLHHRFQPPTAFSAVAFHPIEFACYVFGGQALLFFVPIHPTVMVVAGLYTALQLIEDHSGIAVTPVWPWQPTSYFHDDHHKLFHLNFGQHTLLFDYLWGTLRLGGREYGEHIFGGHGSKNQRSNTKKD